MANPQRRLRAVTQADIELAELRSFPTVDQDEVTYPISASDRIRAIADQYLQTEAAELARQRQITEEKQRIFHDRLGSAATGGYVQEMEALLDMAASTLQSTGWGSKSGQLDPDATRPVMQPVTPPHPADAPTQVMEPIWPDETRPDLPAGTSIVHNGNLSEAALQWMDPRNPDTSTEQFPPIKYGTQ